jgi:hypothetical protein
MTYTLSGAATAFCLKPREILRSIAPVVSSPLSNDNAALSVESRMGHFSG